MDRQQVHGDRHSPYYETGIVLRSLLRRGKEMGRRLPATLTPLAAVFLRCASDSSLS
jgi:hypothetical protein